MVINTLSDRIPHGSIRRDSALIVQVVYLKAKGKNALAGQYQWAKGQRFDGSMAQLVHRSIGQWVQAIIHWLAKKDSTFVSLTETPHKFINFYL